MTAIVSRTEAMPSFNNLQGLDEAHTPSSEYSFTQSHMLSSNGSGFFSYCQTGPADLNGSSWDATEQGSQNFFQDSGDLYAGDEDFALSLGQMTPTQDLVDKQRELKPKRRSSPTAETKAFKSEPMRRGASKSSVASSKDRKGKASSKKDLPSVPVTLASASAKLSSFELTGNGSSPSMAHVGPVINAAIMDMQQYLPQDMDTLAGTPQMTPPTFYPTLMGMAQEGIPFSAELGSGVNQHVDPTCTQIFAPSLACTQGNSPQSWDSFTDVASHISSPPTPPEDTWPGMAFVSSPTATANSSPPRLEQNVDPLDLVPSEDVHALQTVGEDGLLPAYGARRPSGERESARDHYLYKNAFPRDDGLFHCPWEGQPSCNHKPEKLKCNYDKFVDSHLKPYRCNVPSCENSRFSSTACLLRHEREAHAMHGHGDKPYLCTYQGCDRSAPGNGFPRQWNLKDHMRRVHNDNGDSAARPAGTTEPAPSSHKESGKNKKRKDTTDSAPNRKKSTRASAVLEAVADASQEAEDRSSRDAADQWYAHQKALQALVQGFIQPGDPAFAQQAKEAQEHMLAMQHITSRLASKDNNSALRMSG